MAKDKKQKKSKKVAQSKDSYLVTLCILVEHPIIDESQLIARATKRVNVFQNAYKGSKSVKLSEVTMKRL